jgi:hypothetical protein
MRHLKAGTTYEWGSVILLNSAKTKAIELLTFLHDRRIKKDYASVYRKVRAIKLDALGKAAAAVEEWGEDWEMVPTL